MKQDESSTVKQPENGKRWKEQSVQELMELRQKLLSQKEYKTKVIQEKLIKEI